MIFGEEGYGRIGGGTRVLELAADGWEGRLGHGTRRQSPAPWGRGLMLRMRWVAAGGAARSGGGGP
jgi:hypothetical protein